MPIKQHTHNKKKYAIYSAIFICGLILSSCSSTPKYIKKKIDNACDILNTDTTWRAAFDNTYRKYGAPPHVVMAIIHQESRFIANARPPRKKVLGIPSSRPSNAYGYAQALKETWAWYKNKTNNKKAARDNLTDAVDFIGWYLQTNHERTGVSKWDAKRQYLAYHEGSGGYLKKTYLKKPWLVAVSEKVKNRATTYRKQLAQCYIFPEL
ncbi:MAG: transglycosylase SLT domain-containing protein [Gammaproteobacteria bacterium]|nr:transglycosylase SLT domain-containing protein [Gammaproteobacteria bacterium]